MSILETLGWDAERASELAALDEPALAPARVAVQHRGAWDVLGELGELRCDVAGRLRHDAATPAELPVVGDWVGVSRREERSGTIHAVLARRTRFSRKTAWQAAEEQVLVANVDVVFVATSLNEDLNLRRLERYLTLAWESGATPELLLTKADLVDDPLPSVAAVEAIAFGAAVHVVSTRTGRGLEELRARIPRGCTAALLGSSGVGKSTLVNALAGEALMATQEIRADGRGRHTTSRRELTILPGGGVIVDTPGLREVQLWEADDGLAEAFEDVTSLFGACRFSDCAHETEPGCAVRAALDDGRLQPERWSSYLKLQRELAHLERRLDRRAQGEERKRWKAITQDARAQMRLKGRDV